MPSSRRHLPSIWPKPPTAPPTQPCTQQNSNTRTTRRGGVPLPDLQTSSQPAAIVPTVNAFQQCETQADPELYNSAPRTFQVQAEGSTSYAQNVMTGPPALFFHQGAISVRPEIEPDNALGLYVPSEPPQPATVAGPSINTARPATIAPPGGAQSGSTKKSRKRPRQCMDTTAQDEADSDSREPQGRSGLNISDNRGTDGNPKDCHGDPSSSAPQGEPPPACSAASPKTNKANKRPLKRAELAANKKGEAKDASGAAQVPSTTSSGRSPPGGRQRPGGATAGPKPLSRSEPSTLPLDNPTSSCNGSRNHSKFSGAGFLFPNDSQAVTPAAALVISAYLSARIIPLAASVGPGGNRLKSSSFSLQEDSRATGPSASGPLPERQWVRLELSENSNTLSTRLAATPPVDQDPMAARWLHDVPVSRPIMLYLLNDRVYVNLGHGTFPRPPPSSVICDPRCIKYVVAHDKDGRPAAPSVDELLQGLPRCGEQQTCTGRRSSAEQIRTAESQTLGSNGQNDDAKGRCNLHDSHRRASLQVGMIAMLIFKHEVIIDTLSRTPSSPSQSAGRALQMSRLKGTVWPRERTLREHIAYCGHCKYWQNARSEDACTLTGRVELARREPSPRGPRRTTFDRHSVACFHCYRFMAELFQQDVLNHASPLHLPYLTGLQAFEWAPFETSTFCAPTFKGLFPVPDTSGQTPWPPPLTPADDPLCIWQLTSLFPDPDNIQLIFGVPAAQWDIV